MKRFTAYLPNKIYEELAKLAKDRECSMNDVVKAALAEYIQRSKVG